MASDPTTSHEPADSDEPAVTDSATAPAGSKLLAYLQLFRAPNVFTAIADVAMAYFVTAQSMRSPLEFALLVAATCFLYTAGMVLNDVFDFEVDRIERPQRPLPSGRISRVWAKWLGIEMLAVGVAAAWMAGVVSTSDVPLWRPGLVSILLAACILFYDAVAKKFWIGPIVMGSCRFLNVLLGMSLYAAVPGDSAQLLGFGTSHLMIAGGIGLYIVGVTVFARSEATQSDRRPLVLGVAVMASGIAMLASFPYLHPGEFPYRIEPESYWPLGLLLISVWILRRCVAAIAKPEPYYVQTAIKFCLMSLIILDATLCLLVCPSPYAISILALLVPMLLLGRRVYST